MVVRPRVRDDRPRGHDELDPDDFDLAGAAAELAVHYQTAYRWVRDGSLPARVAKGVYRIDRAELQAFVDERSRRAGHRARPARRSPVQSSRACDQFRAALLRGDEKVARSFVHRALRTMSVTSLLDHVVAPSMCEVGVQWQSGTVTIWAEHRATAIVGRILGEIGPNPRGRRRGCAVVASVSGDRHSLATEMAVAALREDSWRVHHLGSDVPAGEIVEFCRSETVHLAVVTVTFTDVAALAYSVSEQLGPLGVPTIVGGPGRTLHELQTLSRLSRGARSAPMTSRRGAGV